MSNARIIEVVPYDPEWPKLFLMESLSIRQALGGNCIGIHHIGSTSVPGLAAKPVIDIMPVVRDIMKVDKANHAMEKLGYTTKGEFGMPFRRYFQKGGEQRTHNTHVFEERNPEIERHLKFGDWMRLHPDDRDAYAKLKQELAQKYPNDIDAYCFGKESFIADIDNKSGCSGLRIVKALLADEWEAVHRFRQHCLFDKSSIPDSFEHKNHVHFILYQGVAIKGYAHLELWPDDRAALHMLVIEESSQNQGIGGQFLILSERWLRQQGISELQTESPPESMDFYLKKGYFVVPFNDPENHNNETRFIPLGKLL